MKRIKFMMKTMVALGVLVLGCSMAQAQATRTWVSGVGNDMDPCSRVAPCKTFAGAYAKTAVGGQINVIDAGGFGTLTIDHSITIDGSESYSGVLATGSNGIVIGAGASDVVVLRGLTLVGGDDGIFFKSGARLQVESCVISGFSQTGIDFQPNSTSQLIVKDTIIRESGTGISIQPNGGKAQTTIENTRVEGNKAGLSVVDSLNVTVRDSVLAGNGSNGVEVSTQGGQASVSIENCLMANNGGTGVEASGSKAQVRLSGSTVTGNAIGLDTSGGATIDSYTNNNVGGNGVDGAVSNKIPKV